MKLSAWPYMNDQRPASTKIKFFFTIIGVDRVFLFSNNETSRKVKDFTLLQQRKSSIDSKSVIETRKKYANGNIRRPRHNITQQ